MCPTFRPQFTIDIIILAGTAAPSTTTVTVPTDVTGETRLFM